MRVAHSELVHVRERISDVVDRGTALADSLRDEARAAVQIELAHICGMRGVCEKRERADLPSPRDLHLEEPGRVHATRHLALPEARQRASHAVCVDAVGHAPARAAAAQSHHQARLAPGAAVAGGQDAQRPVVAVDSAARLLDVRKARRPHERAVAEHPEIAFRQLGQELVQRHRLTLTRRASRRLTPYKIGAMSARRPPLVGRYTGEERAPPGATAGAARGAAPRRDPIRAAPSAHPLRYSARAGRLEASHSVSSSIPRHDLDGLKALPSKTLR